MKLKYRNKISFHHILINLVIITGFFYLLFNAHHFQTYSKLKIVEAYSNDLSILKEEIPDDSSINVNNIFIDQDLNGVITYIVQPGDTLSKISVNFGVTIKHIKKVNKLRKDIIRPGQRLTISDEEGILYESKGENIKQLAFKFKIKSEDILESNGLDDLNYRFDKGDEVFIPITDEQYKKLFKTVAPIRRPSISRPTRNSVSTIRYKGKNVIAKYRYRPNISNGFYRGHCTWYVALKKFPYINKKKQKKLWNGNARYWYQNAKKAGYSVGKIPKIGAIVVIRFGGRRYHYAGHVAIVRQIDWKNKKLLVEEMNALGKYVVTKRWIRISSKIVGYIYYRLSK